MRPVQAHHVAVRRAAASRAVATGGGVVAAATAGNSSHVSIHVSTRVYTRVKPRVYSRVYTRVCCSGSFYVDNVVQSESGDSPVATPGATPAGPGNREPEHHTRCYRYIDAIDI